MAKSIKLHKSSSASSVFVCVPHIIANDLLPDILVFLPLKSLIRFSVVCKRWFSIISDPKFRRLLISNSNHKPKGILITLWGHGGFSSLDYFPFDNNNSTPLKYFDDFTLVKQGYRLAPLQSCNGLLLSSAYLGKDGYSYRCFVSNLTTKKSFLLPTLPPPPERGIYHVKFICIAYDPRRSPYYTVVAFVRLTAYSEPTYQICLYFSMTGVWKLSGTTFRQGMSNFHTVYCNGAVHLIRPWHPSFYFNIQNEMFLPMPSVPSVLREGGDLVNHIYIGESYDRLHFAGSGFAQLRVYELKTDYSEWFIKHTVCLRTSPMRLWDYRKLKLISFVCGEEDDSFLVFRVSKSIIRCSLVHNTCEKIHHIKERHDLHAFQYIESLSDV